MYTKTAPRRFVDSDLLEAGHLIPIDCRKHTIGKKNRWAHLPTVTVTHNKIAIKTRIVCSGAKQLLAYQIFEFRSQWVETFFSHVLQDRCQRVTGFETMAASKQNRLWQKAIENLQAPAIDLLLALARLLVHAFICRCAGNFHSKYFHQRMVQDWVQLQKITGQDLAQDVSQCIIMSSCRSIVSITTSPSLPLPQCLSRRNGSAHRD